MDFEERVRGARERDRQAKAAYYNGRVAQQAARRTAVLEFVAFAKHHDEPLETLYAKQFRSETVRRGLLRPKETNLVVDYTPVAKVWRLTFSFGNDYDGYLPGVAVDVNGNCGNTSGNQRKVRGLSPMILRAHNRNSDRCGD